MHVRCATACNGSRARSSGSTRSTCALPRARADLSRTGAGRVDGRAVPRARLRGLHRSRRQRDRHARMPMPIRPYVALTAHLDTVLAPRTKEDISVDPDGRFRGPGVSDNGAGLAALLAVARALKSCAQAGGYGASNLVFVANVGEEGEGQPERHAPPLQAVAAGEEDLRLPDSGWRQHRPHHHPRPGQPPLRGHLHRTGRP